MSAGKDQRVPDRTSRPIGDAGRRDPALLPPSTRRQVSPHAFEAAACMKKQGQGAVFRCPARERSWAQMRAVCPDNPMPAGYAWLSAPFPPNSELDVQMSIRPPGGRD